MIKALTLIIYNILRIFLMKCMHLGQVQISWIQRISPLCALKIFGKGTLTIGRNCDLSAYCDLEVHGNGSINIGHSTYMNRYCMISAHNAVAIGNNCLFGPGVKIFDNNHKHSPETGVSTDLSTAPISIGNNCWIASNVIILKGTSIGDNCVIGAGCILHGEIPAGSIVKCKQDLIIS